MLLIGLMPPDIQVTTGLLGESPAQYCFKATILVAVQAPPTCSSGYWVFLLCEWLAIC